MALSLDFAFEGFRILKDRPKLIAFWAIIGIVGGLANESVLVGIAGPAIEQLRHFTPGGDVTTMTVPAQQFMVAWLLSQVVGLMMTPTLAAAVFRAVSGETDDGLAFLKFGARELQLTLVMAANIVLILGVPMACMAATVFLKADVAALPALLALGAAPWLWIRLSLNMAQTFAEKRVVIFGSFALTQGAFWPLLGGYLIAMTLAVVVFFLGEQVAIGVVAGLFGGTGLDAAPDMTSLQAYMSPERVTALVVMYGAVWPQIMAIVMAAPAAAYQRLNGQKPALGPEQAF